MDTPLPTDAELVASTLAGRRGAYGTLYDRHARLVRALFYATGIPWSVVEDLTQECFLRAYRKLRSLREPQRFGPWLLAIARLIAREQRRRLFRDRHTFAGAAPDDVPAADDFTLDVQTAEELRLMQQHLAQLPDDERLAIHAFFLKEQTAHQAAELLQLSRSGFYALLQRAVGRLAARLQRLGSGRDPS